MTERCTNHSVSVYGSSSKPYTVSVKDGLPTCTCPDYYFKVSRSKNKDADAAYAAKPLWCKHIEAQFEKLCNWRGTTVVVKGLCPRCSNPTEEVE